MMTEKHELEKFLEPLRNLLSEYKEFWFFLSGLILGYVLHAIA